MLVVSYLCLFFLVSIAVFVDSVSFEEDVRVTQEQKSTIDKLRQKLRPFFVEPFMDDDLYLAKFLRSTNFDLEWAQRKLMDNIRWRNKTGMATIDEEDFSEIAYEYPYYAHGYDKEGRPVFVAFAGVWDVRGAVVTGRASKVLRYLEKQLELQGRQIRRLQQEGKNVTQAILIVDLNQFSLVTHGCVQCLLRMVDFLHSYEAHFPGMADKIIFVDAPPTVQFVLAVIRENVSKETRDAIRVYGTNKEQWQNVLRQYIDKNYLPVELGGTVERH